MNALDLGTHKMARRYWWTTEGHSKGAK